MMQDSAGQLPHSEACERNKGVILNVLRESLAPTSHVLEVGSGTGQHVVHFAAAMSETRWQPSDTGDYLHALKLVLGASTPDNVADAVEIDVRMAPWPVQLFDAVFSANTLHFMAKECVRNFFRGVEQVLKPGGVLIVYGPFNYAGQYTSESNARFDEWLKESDPQRAIRDFEWVNELAAGRGLSLRKDIVMPANNRALVWGRGTNL